MVAWVKRRRSNMREVLGEVHSFSHYFRNNHSLKIIKQVGTKFAKCSVLCCLLNKRLMHWTLPFDQQCESVESRLNVMTTEQVRDNKFWQNLLWVMLQIKPKHSTKSSHVAEFNVYRSFLEWLIFNWKVIWLLVLKKRERKMKERNWKNITQLSLNFTCCTYELWKGCAN